MSCILLLLDFFVDVFIDELLKTELFLTMALGIICFVSSYYSGCGSDWPWRSSGLSVLAGGIRLERPTGYYSVGIFELIGVEIF